MEANTLTEMVNKISILFDDIDLCNKISYKANKIIQDNFNKEIIYKKISSLLEKISIDQNIS